MSRPVEQFNAQKAITVGMEVQVVQIAEDLYIYREESKVLSAQDAEGSTIKTGKRGESGYEVEGFIDGKGREALLNGEVPERLPLLVAPSGLLERLRTLGYHRVDEELYALREQKLWEMLQADLNLSAENLIRIDYGNHMVYDYKGNPQPAALFFNYIQSRITESTHDLKRLAAYLLERPDIEVYQDVSGSRWDVAKTVDKAIFDIPHYNAEEGETNSILFSWSPSKEEYAQVCSQARGGGSPSQLIEVVISQDFLKLNQFQPPTRRRRPSP